jgi:O-antigen ligase
MSDGGTRAASAAVDSGVSSHPARRLFWIPIVIVDLVLLLSLRHAEVVLAVLTGIGIMVVLWRHPRAGLACASLGMILFNPLNRVFGSEVPTFAIERMILLGPLGFHAWNRMWSPSTPSRLWREPLFRWALLLGLVLLVGYLWSPLPLYGRFKVSYYFLDNLLLLVAGFVLLRSRSGDPGPAVAAGFRFFQAVLFLAIAVAGAAIYNDITYEYPFGARLVALGANTIHLSKLMAMGLFTILFLGAARRIRLFLAIPAALLFAWVFYRTGSRGPLLATAVALAFWIMTGRGRSSLSFRIVTGIALVAGVISFLILLPGLGESWLGPLTGREGSNAVRLHLLELARDGISDAWPWGLGTGGFPALMKLADVRYFPHNLLVEVLIENGLAGAVALFGFLASLFFYWNRARREIREGETVPGQRILFRAAGSLLVFSLVMAQVSGDIITNDWIWLWCGAMLAWMPRRERAQAPLGV